MEENLAQDVAKLQGLLQARDDTIARLTEDAKNAQRQIDGMIAEMYDARQNRLDAWAAQFRAKSCAIVRIDGVYQIHTANADWSYERALEQEAERERRIIVEKEAKQ